MGKVKAKVELGTLISSSPKATKLGGDDSWGQCLIFGAQGPFYSTLHSNVAPAWPGKLMNVEGKFSGNVVSQEQVE